MLFHFLLYLALIFPCVSFAENTFFDKQVAPGLEKSIDSKSLYLLFGGSLGVTAAHQYDDSVHIKWKDHAIWSKETTQWGDNYGRYAVGILIAAGQSYFDRTNGFNHLRALIANALTTSALKIFVHRERPDKSDHLSFPSGHSSDAFTSATSLTYAYGWKTGIIAYPLATYIAVSRVADDVHWLSDIAAGAVVGIWMGRAFFYSKNKEENEQQLSWNWQIVPDISSHFSGVNFATEF